MKLSKLGICLAAAIFAVISTRADSPRYDVYLLAGQSNMCGQERPPRRHGGLRTDLPELHAERASEGEVRGRQGRSVALRRQYML